MPSRYQLLALGVSVAPELPTAVMATFTQLDDELATVRSHRLAPAHAELRGREQDRFAGWSPEKPHRLRQLG